MADQLKVRAVEGRELPLEGMPARRVVGEMSVPNTAYYRRAIRRGDLTEVDASKATTTRRTVARETTEGES